MSGRTPTSPTSSYHRLLRTMVTLNHEDEGLSPTPKELDLVAKVFVKAGGSWEKLAKGSVDDFDLMRRVIKVAIKKGYISKSPKWG